jgi:hypothetical protein
VTNVDEEAPAVLSGRGTCTEVDEVAPDMNCVPEVKLKPRVPKERGGTGRAVVGRLRAGFVELVTGMLVELVRGVVFAMVSEVGRDGIELALIPRKLV